MLAERTRQQPSPCEARGDALSLFSQDSCVCNVSKTASDFITGAQNHIAMDFPESSSPSFFQRFAINFLCLSPGHGKFVLHIFYSIIFVTSSLDLPLLRVLEQLHAAHLCKTKAKSIVNVFSGFQTRKTCAREQHFIFTGSIQDCSQEFNYQPFGTFVCYSLQHKCAKQSDLGCSLTIRFVREATAWNDLLFLSHRSKITKS